jgi:hypothetical protein
MDTKYRMQATNYQFIKSGINIKPGVHVHTRTHTHTMGAAIECENFQITVLMRRVEHKKHKKITDYQQ